MKTKSVQARIYKPRVKAVEAPLPPEANDSAEGTRPIADSYTIYLREVGQTPMITPAEEIALSKQIKKGNKAAREKMIKANLRLVVKIARDYENYGLPLLDLVSEGNIGLMKAVDRFDSNKGAKLSTYASFWIKQAIRSAISNQSKTIRLPVHVNDKLLHIRRAEAKFQNEFGRAPTDDELSDELGIAAKRIAQYRKAAINPASLDSKIGDDDSSTISELVADENADTPYQQLQEKTDAHLINEVLPMLEPREQEILRSRFGLNGDKEQTLEEVGLKFGVTRERIRQIQEGALAKLRRKITELETMSVAE